MIRLGIIFTLLLMPLSMALSAGKAPPPLQHNKIVVPDEEKGALYWPLDLPLYVRLATTPEEGAQTFLLKNMLEGTEGNLNQVEGSALHLEMSGPQFIRWHNYVTEDTFFLKFTADGTPPEVGATFTGATKSYSNSTTFYSAGLKSVIEATDHHSGTREIYVSIDGAGYEPYPGEMSFSDEKRYLLATYAVDRVGNASEPRAWEFVLDKTAPSTKHQIVDNYIGNVLNAKATFRLLSTDPLSSVAATYYTFGAGDNFSRFTGTPVGVGGLDDGEHIFRYYSVDAVGNKEKPQEYSFFLDKNSPEVTLTLLGDSYKNGPAQWISPRTLIQLEAYDRKAGLDAIEFAINKGRWTAYGEPFVLGNHEGNFVIVYRGRDRLGNDQTSGSFNTSLDGTAPKTTHTFNGNTYSQRGITWLQSATRVQLNPRDGGSGVRVTTYRVGEDPPLTYTDAFAIPNEGRYELRYYSIDQVNNRESENIFMLDVDNSPPGLTFHFSVSPTGSDKSSDGKMVEFFPINTSLFLAATDGSSGTDKITYQLNKGNAVEFNSPIVFNKAGEKKLTVKATDRVGNTTEKELIFIVRD
ncbi:hypothetical protein K8I28_01725 [bacterium]|nr:hypothetical protein [bacterium]